MAETEKKVKGFFLYFDQYESIKLLSNEQKGILLDAMFKSFAGEDFEIEDPLVRMAFTFIEQTFKRDYDKYQKVCERNRKNRNNKKDDQSSPVVTKRDQNDQSSPLVDLVTKRDEKKSSSAFVTSGDIEREIEREREIENIYKGQNAPDTPQKKFVPPTLEEVQAYCEERGNAVDAGRFIDFYSAKGWMIGKNKVKDWRACIRTWEKGSSQGSLISITSQSRDPNRCIALPKPPGWE